MHEVTKGKAQEGEEQRNQRRKKMCLPHADGVLGQWAIEDGDEREP